MWSLSIFLILLFFVSTVISTVYEGDDKNPFYPEAGEKKVLKLIPSESQTIQFEEFSDPTCATPTGHYKCLRVSKCYQRKHLLDPNSVFAQYTQEITDFEIWLFEEILRSDQYKIYIDYFNKNNSEGCDYTQEYIDSEMAQEEYDDVKIGVCTPAKIGANGRFFRVYMNCPKEDYNLDVWFQTVVLGIGVLVPMFCCCCFCFICMYWLQKCYFNCYACYFSCCTTDESEREVKRKIRESSWVDSPEELMEKGDGDAIPEAEDEGECAFDEDEEAGKDSEGETLSEEEEEGESESDDYGTEDDEAFDEGGETVYSEQEEGHGGQVQVGIGFEPPVPEDADVQNKVDPFKDDREIEIVHKQGNIPENYHTVDGERDAVLPSKVSKYDVSAQMADHVYEEGKIESEKLMNPEWLNTDSELRDYSSIKEQCCFGLKSLIGVAISIAYMLILELKKLSAVYVSFICFLNTDYDVTDPFYPEKELTVRNYQFFFIGAFLVYIVIQGLMLTWWVRTHIFSPIKVTMIYALYNEWIGYRMLQSFLYLFYIFYGAPAWYSTNERVFDNINSAIVESWNDSYVLVVLSGSFWSAIIFYAKFGVSLLLLASSVLKAVSYDGYSSINYYHRIKNTTWAFPYVKFGFPNIMKTPDENLAQLILMFSLILHADEQGIQEDINTYANSTDFGHLGWSMIKKLNWKEIIFLKYKIFSIEDMDNIQLKHEEELGDTMKYIPPIKPVWWRAFFCFTCCLLIRRIRKKKEHEDELEKSKVGKSGWERLKDDYHKELGEKADRKKKKLSRKDKKRAKKRERNRLEEFKSKLKEVKRQNECLHHRIRQLSLGHDRKKMIQNQIDFFVDENNWLRNEIIRLKIKNYVGFYNDNNIDLSHGILEEHGLIRKQTMYESDSDDYASDEDSAEQVNDQQFTELEDVQIEEKKEEKDGENSEQNVSEGMKGVGEEDMQEKQAVDKDMKESDADLSSSSEEKKKKKDKKKKKKDKKKKKKEKKKKKKKKKKHSSDEDRDSKSSSNDEMGVIQDEPDLIGDGNSLVDSIRLENVGRPGSFDVRSIDEGVRTDSDSSSNSN